MKRMIDTQFLQEIAAADDIILSESALAQFDLYAQLLVEWNEKINLTAITQPEAIVIRHFYDSLLPLTCVNLPKKGRLIDVGTGAGFPGIPIKLVREDVRLTLLDSLNKRVNFLQEVCTALSVEADCIHARAEEAGQDAALREQFDLATARAVSRLRELSEYCLPFVKAGGYFAALKGPDAEEELAEALPAIRLLGGEVEEVCPFSLPDGSSRNIIVIKKISQTPSKFPRPAAKMKKQPIV